MASLFLLVALLAGEPAADSTPRIDVAKKQTWAIGQCRYSIAAVELRKSDARASFAVHWKIENVSEQETLPQGEVLTRIERATTGDDKGTPYKLLYSVSAPGHWLAPGESIKYSQTFRGLPFAKAKQLEIGIGFGDDAATFVIPRKLFGKPVRY